MPCLPTQLLIYFFFLLFFASLYARRRLSAGHRLCCEVCVGTAESGPVFPHRWGCINTGGRGRKSTWGHTHTVLCVCADSRKSQSNEKRREFLFDSTGNPRRVCPGMRTALEAGRNRENGKKRRKKGTKKSGA